jgi:hypothetical protein
MAQLSVILEWTCSVAPRNFLRVKRRMPFACRMARSSRTGRIKETSLTIDLHQPLFG